MIDTQRPVVRASANPTNATLLFTNAFVVVEREAVEFAEIMPTRR